MKADSIPESERVLILEKPDKDLLKASPTIEYDVDLIKKYRALCRGHVKVSNYFKKLTPKLNYDVDLIKNYRALCRGHVKVSNCF